MGINIQARNDYSTLFSSMPNNSQNNTFSLTDYASIKNGSYFKAMKAYYAKDASGNSVASQNGMDSSIKGASTDSAAVNSNIQGKATSLVKSTEALMGSGKNSVFEKKDIVSKDAEGNETKSYDYDKDKIAQAVSSFVKDYNGMIDAAIKSNNESVVTKASDMVTQSLQNEKFLNNIGITIGEDNKLSLDTDKLKKADVSSVKSVFQGAGSYAYGIQSKASYMNMYAKEDAAKASGTYSSAATYTANLNTGNILNSFM